MKIVSFNCRGLVSPSKNSSLKRLIDSMEPNIIFIQETLGDSSLIKGALESLMPNFSFEAVDARGRSGGMVSRWKLRSCKCGNVWGFGSHMGMEILFEEFGRSYTLINIYGPYNDKVPFWERLLKCSFLEKESLILEGDLNFTLGEAKHWGPRESLILYPTFSSRP